MTNYDKLAYEEAFPGVPIWKPGDLVRIVQGSDVVVGFLGRVQSLSRKRLSYTHFDCVVEVGSVLVHCLPDSLVEPSVLEKLADEV